MTKPVLAQPILAGKLTPPADRPGHIVRQAVRDLFCKSQYAKVILFQAPAGFGKTIAMAQCHSRLAETGVSTAWLTLEEADNDPPRFLGSLAAAAELIAGETWPDLARGGDRSERWVGEIALEIIGRLSAQPSPFALFLDDFEVLREPAVLGVVREIIDHLPRCGQLVIGARGLPELGLGRLRAREELLELDARELRFSADETAEFFSRRVGQSLGAADVSRLHERTEGWAAALSLASLVLERHGTAADVVEGFSGSHDAVAQYLLEDVLGQQSPDVRRFLLHTSILRELQVPLCEALVPGAGSDQLLEQLERANLFLTPVAVGERRYRCHSLFASFLRAQLVREEPGVVKGLHRTASRWYEGQGRPIPALDHALEAGDYARAVALLDGNAATLLAQGRVRLLTRWFEHLPANALRGHQLLQAIQASALAFTHGPANALAFLQRSACSRSKDPEVAAQVSMIRPLFLVLMDRYDEAYEIARESLARMPAENRLARTSLARGMADMSVVMGRNGDARRLLEAARRDSGEAESSVNVTFSELVEGLIDLQEGRLRQATARFRMAVGASHADPHPRHTGGNYWPGIFLAFSVYEANDLDQAAKLLNVYLPFARDAGLPDHMLLGWGMLSRIAFVRGDVDEAFRLLSELEHLGEQRQIPRVAAGAKLERARLLLKQGHAAAAAGELERADDEEVWARAERLRYPAEHLEYLEFGRLRWEVAAGKPRDALPRLEKQIEAAVTASRGLRALKLRLLRAIALGRCGEERAAVAQGTEVLRAASQEGFVRIVLDEGALAAEIVRQVDERSRAGGAQRRDPAFGEFLQRLRTALGVQDSADTDEEHNETLVEPLTAKEIDVLKLLSEGYSNFAMAEKLLVADTTIRTHLRNINGKLNARSRTHAIAVARNMGIIS
jgi:LuxR family maltose regulon positive regulatory protein